MTSGGVSFFMTENRLVGYLLAGTSLVLWALIALLRSMHLGGRYFKLGLLVGVIAAGIGSPGLLWYTYEHPAPKAPVTRGPLPASAVAPSQATENSSHNTYKNSATGANSPVVTGDNAVVIIGNSDDQAAQRAKKRR